jgi:hypothetical protein
MAKETYTITLVVEVTDPAQLWRKAKAYLVGQGLMRPSDRREDIIGSELSQRVGHCLIMLLDRNEHLEGATIEESSWECLEDLGE